VTLLGLALRGARHDLRSRLGLLAAIFIGTAVLTGALVVGDSVRGSLHELRRRRLGAVHSVISSGDRALRAALADELAAALGSELHSKPIAAPVLQLPASAGLPDGSIKGLSIELYGVDERFFLAAPRPGQAPPKRGEVQLSRALALSLGAKSGDELVLRVEEASALPRDAALVSGEDRIRALTLQVSAILGDESFGRFSIAARQTAPLNAFVSLAQLQESVGLEGRAKLILLADQAGQELASEAVAASLREHWRPADLGLTIREGSAEGWVELASERVFIDEALADPKAPLRPDGAGAIGYFVTGIQSGAKSTPYSFVAALDAQGVFAGHPAGSIGPDEIVLTDWLAADLGATVGGEVELRYDRLAPDRKLVEGRRRFRVKAVIPLRSKDRDLVPKLPGLSGKNSCRDWDSGLPIKLGRIRDKDEDYWKRFGATPKAYVSLETGRGMWANRYGSLTALRFPMPAASRASIEAEIRRRIDPAELGLTSFDLRADGARAVSQAIDFGGLFVGLSFFLIGAAMLLVFLLSAFDMERRASELGLLRALGFSAPQLRRLRLLESLFVALPGALLGAIAGAGYAAAILAGLAGAWRGAVGTSVLSLSLEPMTFILGGLAGLLCCLGAIYLAGRRQLRQSVRLLLQGGSEVVAQGFSGSDAEAGWLSRVSLYGGLPLAVLALIAGAASAQPAAGFFVGGTLFLIAGLGGLRLFLAALARSGAARGAAPRSLTQLGLRGAARRPGRSLAVAGALAAGVFMVVAIGASRRDPRANAGARDSGTGGFALIVETSLPILEIPLRDSEDGEAWGLAPQDRASTAFVPVRLHVGEDASCLNLHRVARPSIAGVDPQAFDQRGAFTLAKSLRPLSDPKSAWALLDADEPDGAIPAFADEETILWALGRSLGDVIEIPAVGSNKLLRLRLVGALSSSIFQGKLLISRGHFARAFPDEAGAGMLLVDAPPGRGATVSAAIKERLGELGPRITSGADRLAAFLVVESTYLSIFLALGAMALVLGSVGLAVVVLRNVLERRGELALLRALGFSEVQVRTLLRTEHALLLGLGLFIGFFSALAAVAPALQSRPGELPLFELAALALALSLGGFLWIELAARLALSGPLLAALREE